MKLSDVMGPQAPANGTGGALTLSQVMQAQPEQGWVDRLSAAFKGNAAEDVRDVSSQDFTDAAGYGAREGLGQALTDFFGSDDSSKSYALAHARGAKETQDANGNAMLELPNGQRFYVNTPGLSLKDIGGLAGKAAMFSPAGRIAGAVENLGARALVGGALAGGTEAAREGVMEREMSPGEMAAATAGGSLGELLMPAVGAGYRAVRGLFPQSPEALKAAGAKIAQAMGAQGMDDAVLIELGKRASQLKQGASPESLLAESEFNIPTTRGQKTGDFGQLSTEERLRNAQSMGGDVMRATQQRQQDAYGKALGNIRDTIAGGNAPGSVAAGFEDVGSAIRANAAKQKGAISDAYNGIDLQGTTAASAAAQQLPGRLKAAVADFGVNPTLHPATASTLSDIERAVGQLPEGSALKLSAIETGRRIINSRLGATTNAADRAALGKVKGEFDAWMGDTMDNALLTGDRETLANLGKARELRAQYARTFERDDQAGKLVQKALDSDMAGEQLANVVLGSAQVSKAATSSTVGRIRQAIGDDPKAWDSFRASVLMRATVNSAGENLGPQAVAGNLKQLLRERPALVQELYGANELSRLQRFTASLDAITRSGDFAKSSGTAERALRYMGSVAGNIPGVGSILRAIQGPADLGAAYRAGAPLTAPRNSELAALFPAIATYGGQ